MFRASDCSRVYEFFLDKSRLTTKSGRIGHGRALFTWEVRFLFGSYVKRHIIFRITEPPFPHPLSYTSLYLSTVQRLSDWNAFRSELYCKSMITLVVIGFIRDC